MNTNSTGTFDLYAGLFDEWRDDVYEDYYTYNYNAGYPSGITISYTTGDKFLVNHEDNVFSFLYEDYYYFFSPYFIVVDDEIFVRYAMDVNTKTGLVMKTEMLYFKDTLYDGVGKMHLLIESNYEEASSDWFYSLISIPVLAWETAGVVIPDINRKMPMTINAIPVNSMNPSPSLKITQTAPATATTSDAIMNNLVFSRFKIADMTPKQSKLEFKFSFSWFSLSEGEISV